MVELISFSSFKLYLKYALRDLSRSYSKILSIIITLFISLFILSSILTIEDSLETEIKNNSKLLLGGDIEIDYNQVKGNLDLVNKVKEFATISQMVEFSTMVSTIDKEKNKSSFTRIKSVDADYPLYGEVAYEPKGALEKLNEENNTILVNENIFKNLNLQIDEIVKVQDQEFKVVGYVKSVPDIGGAFVFGDFALTGKKTLDTLNLNNLGSFLNYEYKVKFNEEISVLDGLKKVEELFANEERARIRKSENAAGGLRRIIDNFSQFLSLVSISAMLIAGIGIANTLLSFINQKNSSIAVQKAIGIFSGNIKTIYYIQLSILLVFVSVFAYGLSFLLIPIIDEFVSDGLGLNIDAKFSIINFTKIFLVGLLVIILFSIPTVNSIDQIKATSLFRNVFQSLQFKYTKLSIFLSLVFLILLMSLFSVGSSNPIYSIGYFISFFFCLVVFFILSRLTILFLRKNKYNFGISFKVALKNSH